MGRSSLLGVERATPEPIGRDVATLGPSDSSDSGSDMAGVEMMDQNDPTEPVDAALNTDVARTWTDVPDGATADASGTGERRAAGNDAGRREAADISVDRVFDPASEGTDDELDDDEDPDLAFIDAAQAEDVLDDENAGDDDAPRAGIPVSGADGAAAAQGRSTAKSTAAKKGKPAKARADAASTAKVKSSARTAH